MVIFVMSSVIKQYSPAGVLSLKSEMLKRVMTLIIKGHLLVAVDNVIIKTSLMACCFEALSSAGLENVSAGLRTRHRNVTIQESNLVMADKHLRCSLSFCSSQRKRTHTHTGKCWLQQR